MIETGKVILYGPNYDDFTLTC